MNGFGTSDFLTTFDRANLRADAKALCADTEVGVSVVYRQRGTPSHNFATGTVTESFTNFDINAAKAPTENDEGSGVQLGDVTFLVAALLFDDELKITPGASDEIVEGSTVYQVLSAERDPVSVLWRIRCRREGVTS